MQLFRDVLDECSFMDLGFIGPCFTWSKHFLDGHSIWEGKCYIHNIFTTNPMWQVVTGC